LQQAAYTCLAFSSDLLLVGKADGAVMVLRDGILVSQLGAHPAVGVDVKERVDVNAQLLSVADVQAFGSGCVAATAGGNVAVFSAVRRGR
jgi:hypothetical protein